MSIRVKSFLKDVGGAGRVTEARREKLKNASAVPDPKDPIRDLADKLHPSEMQLRVTDIRDASPTAKTFRFEAVDGHIPVFQCGQFVNFRLKIGESLLTRPYTISSAPYEARGEHPFFEITVRRNVPYLVPDYFFENVHVGDVLTGALPFGTLRLRPKGSAGGHNGLKNISELLGTEEYARMRFGVGGDFPKGHQVDYVLGEWTDEERKALPERLKVFVDAIRSFATVGTQLTMTNFNKK